MVYKHNTWAFSKMWMYRYGCQMFKMWRNIVDIYLRILWVTLGLGSLAGRELGLALA